MANEDLRDVKASLAGDEEAFARIIRRHEGEVVRLMWRFSRDRLVCETLVQDVFVEAYFSLKGYRGRGPFAHWLRKIATRVGYRFWKEQGQERQKATVPLLDFDLVEDVDEDSIDPVVAAEILHSLLAQLPQADRLVLTLMYFEQCSTREVAERIGWTRPMVKMRALRARKKMKEIAEKEHLLERLGWTR
jgi:RNA polymerase sigma-70 factor (ECF subfamily)